MQEDTNYWKSKRLNRRQVLRGGLAVGAGLVGLSAGCASGTPTNPTPVPTKAGAAPTTAAAAAATPTPGKPKPTGKLTVASPNFGRETLDPQRNYGGAEHGFIYHTFEAMVMRDQQGKLVPGLATSWSTKDAKTWDFELRKGVKFHNGDLLTAKDAKFALERTRTLEGAPQALMLSQYLDSVEQLDDYKVRVNLTKAYSPFLTPVEAGWYPLPKDHIDKVGIEAFLKNPIGTGPFRFVKGSPVESIELEAVEDHWRQVPSIKTLLIRIVPDMNTRVAMLRAEEADIALNLAASVRKEVESNSRLRFLINPGTNNVFYPFIDLSKKEGDKYVINRNSPFFDKRVRQAANYAIDRQLIADKVYQGTAQPAVTTVVPSEFGFDTTLKPYAYDLAKAKALLKEAGYADGFNADLNGTTAGAEMVQVIASMLNAVGIKTKINLLESIAFLDKFPSRQMSGIVALGHPAMYDGWRPLYHYTRSGVWSATLDPEFDKMVDDIEAEPDDRKREDMLKKAIRREYDESYNIFVINTSALHAASDRILDWQQQAGLGLFKRAEYMKLKS